MPLPDEIRAIWEEIRDARGRSSRVGLPVPGGRAGDDEFELYPYLECSSEYYRPLPSPLYVGEIVTRPPGISWSPKITVWNSGTFPTWACHVEVRENPGDILKAQTVITLQPGESRDVILPVTTGQDETSLSGLLGVCYDPLLDPYHFDVRWTRVQPERKMTRLALIRTGKSRICRIRALEWKVLRLFVPE